MPINPDNGQPMGRETILTKLKALSKVRTKAIKPLEHAAWLTRETDRGAMILAATMIDDALLTALEEKVVCENREMRDAVFHGDGPLASFSRRITFAQALDIIDPYAAKVMHTLREIRNVAAHAQVDITFGTQEIRWALSTLIDPPASDEIADAAAPAALRRFYLMMCGIYADRIKGPGGGNARDGAIVRAWASAFGDERPPLPNR